MKQIFYTAVFTLVSVLGLAQDVAFTTSVSATKIGLTDRFQVTYSCNKQGTFVAPRFKDFNQLGGVSQGSNSSVNIINGQVTQSRTYQYSIILQPKSIGTFKVEGAQIKVGNATYESKDVTVEVVKESQARQRPRSIFDQMDEMMRGFPQVQPQEIEITDKDFFARIAVSKSKVTQGEGLLLTYKIYTRNFNFGLENYDFPTHENFWSENIEIPKDIKPSQETIDGIQYSVFTLKKEYVYPQKSGKLALNSFGITARIQTSPFRPQISKKIRSNSPVIEVSPLPANAPESFVNQVGSYKMEVSLARDSVQLNEPIDFKITILGKGNLKQLSQFSLDFPEGIEVYDPEVKNNLATKESGVSGSKSFNYLLIPRKAGKFKLPKIQFTYYDLDSKSYKTIVSPDFEITAYNEDGTIINTDSETEKLNNESATKGEVISFKTSYLWYGLGGLIALGLGILAYFFLAKRRNNEETEETRRKNARKKLAQKLAVAKEHLDKNEVSQFYNETLIGLNKYVNEKLNIETAQMTKTTIRQTLDSKGVGAETTNSFISVLEQCEMAKYAPLSNHNNQEIYEKSLDVIEEIEVRLK